MRTIIFIALLGLAACQTAPATHTPDTSLTRNAKAVVSFGCENGTSFVAAFLVSPDAVELRFPDGRTQTLPHVVSASGARYASATHEFWNKGEEATFTVKASATASTTCRVAK